MVRTPCTTIRRRRHQFLGRALGSLLVVVVALLPAASTASASAPASISSQLAKDTKRLADARGELVDVRHELRTVDRRHRALQGRMTKRVVAIYVSGGNVESIAQIAARGSMRDFGTSLDTLDIVSEHQDRELARWRKLSHRSRQLHTRKVELDATIEDAEGDVRRGRARLSAAQAAADAARASAVAMARHQDSPLLPKVGHPATTAVRVADEAMGDANAGAVDAADQPVGFRQAGVASMYADSFTGQRTSNGETYDPNAFTAASTTLPFGTWVTVQGPSGTVVVRINDRGPFVGGRIIDLSRAAANAVGLAGGVASVTVSVDA